VNVVLLFAPYGKPYHLSRLLDVVVEHQQGLIQVPQVDPLLTLTFLLYGRAPFLFLFFFLFFF